MILPRLFICFCWMISSTYVHTQVIQLASNNISQYLQNHVTFIRFYSNWCPHSKKFEPTWQRFAEMKQNTDLHVAEVDCSEDALLCSEHDIFGYPTVKLFVRGSGARYEGPRHVESLEAFYHDKLSEDANFEDNVVTKRVVVDVTTEDFDQLTSKRFAFVMFFAPWCKHCKILMPIFHELAKIMINTDDLIFATVDCTVQHRICRKYTIQGYPTLIWFENGVEKDRYVESRDVKTMQNYVEQKMKDAQPAPTEEPIIRQEPEEIINESGGGATVLNAKTFTQGVSFEGYAFVNFGAPWCTHCQKLTPVWDQLARKYSAIEDIRISRVDCTASEGLCRDYGIRAFPTLVLFRYGETKVEYNGGRDFESLNHFLISQLEFFGDEYLLKQDVETKNE